jgi:hypothetical protein
MLQEAAPHTPVDPVSLPPPAPPSPPDPKRKLLMKYREEAGKCRIYGGGSAPNGGSSGGDPTNLSACEAKCNNNARCKAFHFYYDGYKSGEGACWL